MGGRPQSRPCPAPWIGDLSGLLPRRRAGGLDVPLKHLRQFIEFLSLPIGKVVGFTGVVAKVEELQRSKRAVVHELPVSVDDGVDRFTKKRATPRLGA